MSSLTPKQALSELMSKFRRSDSDGSSNYSSDEDVDDTSEEEEDGAPVSPLALMNENSPESWLGQFLVMLELGGVTRYGTVTGAKRDVELQGRLLSLKQTASPDIPSPLFDSQASEAMKRQDWGAWWRAQNALTIYSYSALALSMLGDISHIDDVAAMHDQAANSRIRRDAHYVLCYLLGKEWPGYDVRPADIEALRQRSPGRQVASA